MWVLFLDRLKKNVNLSFSTCSNTTHSHSTTDALKIKSSPFINFNFLFIKEFWNTSCSLIYNHLWKSKWTLIFIRKQDTFLRLSLVRAHCYHRTTEHNVVTVFTSGNALLSLPINIGQTLYRLLNHFSVSKVLY